MKLLLLLFYDYGPFENLCVHFENTSGMPARSRGLPLDV